MHRITRLIQLQITHRFRTVWNVADDKQSQVCKYTDKKKQTVEFASSKGNKNKDINNNAIQFNYKGWNITVYNDGGMGDRYESKTGNKSATIEPWSIQSNTLVTTNDAITPHLSYQVSWEKWQWGPVMSVMIDWCRGAVRQRF